jgi:hypothetical protein
MSYAPKTYPKPISELPFFLDKRQIRRVLFFTLENVAFIHEKGQLII